MTIRLLLTAFSSIMVFAAACGGGEASTTTQLPRLWKRQLLNTTRPSASTLNLSWPTLTEQYPTPFSVRTRKPEQDIDRAVGLGYDRGALESSIEELKKQR